MAEKVKVPFGKRIKNFFKDYKSEIKTITWSSNEDVFKNTCVVLAILPASGVAIRAIIKEKICFRIMQLRIGMWYIPIRDMKTKLLPILKR